MAQCFEGVAALTLAMAHWCWDIPLREPEVAQAARPFLYSCSTDPGVRPLSSAFFLRVDLVVALSSSEMISDMRFLRRSSDSSLVSGLGLFFQSGFSLSAFSILSLRA